MKIRVGYGRVSGSGTRLHHVRVRHITHRVVTWRALIWGGRARPRLLHLRELRMYYAGDSFITLFLHFGLHFLAFLG